MFEAIEIQIILGVFFTSIVSGVIGMGGGMILMALYATLLPIKIAMVLHGITQMFSNGFRAYIHREHIRSNIFFAYFVGVIIIFLTLRLFNFIPNKGMLYLLLGAFPFFSFLPKVSEYFSITKKYRPFFCGITVTLAQITAGASGGVLDIFFINSPLSRYQIIATKAFTQTFGHFVKLLYYLSLVSFSTDFKELSNVVYPSVIITSFIGAIIGKKILTHLSEASFRILSKVIILIVGFSLFWKGIIFFCHR